MKNKIEDKDKNALALFRYSLISPVISNIHCFKTNQDYFLDLISKKPKFNGNNINLSLSTLKRWVILYNKGGFNALVPKVRADKSLSRKLDENIILKIKELFKVFPYITGTMVYQRLIDDSLIKKSDVSLSTVLKVIRDQKLKSSSTVSRDMRAFVHEFSNDCWQSDTSYGPYLKIGSEKVRTYLIVTIDDHSRLVTSAKFFFNDNAINMQSVLKTGIKTYGVPKKLYVDNGSVYRNEQLSLICATLGITLIHTKPYQPEGRGKIERFFNTVKRTWLNGINWDDIESLEQLNSLLSKFINDYNNRIHSSLDNTPNKVFIDSYDKIKRLDKDIIEESFLHTTYATIRSDSIARVKCNEYEVPNHYAKSKIMVKYLPTDLSQIFIYENNVKVHTAKLVNKIDNSKIRRKDNIY